MKKTESWSTVAEVIVKVKVIYFLRHELVIIIIIIIIITVITQF